MPLGKYSLRILFAFSIAPFCPEQSQPPDSLCGRLAVDAHRLLDVSPRALLCSAECRLHIDNPLIQQLLFVINIQIKNELCNNSLEKILRSNCQSPDGILLHTFPTGSILECPSDPHFLPCGKLYKGICNYVTKIIVPLQSITGDFSPFASSLIDLLLR